MSLLHLELACGERLEVHRFTVSEAVSSLFTVQVLARSPDPCLDLDAIFGQPAALRIPSAGRLWSGLCCRVKAHPPPEPGEGEAGLFTYEIAFVPDLWRLTAPTCSRIFERLSIPEIARELLEAEGLTATWRIHPPDHPRFPCRTQYDESSFDFLMRLLEEAGIAATFTDEDGERSRLVLSDALHRSAPVRAAPLRYIEHLEAPGGGGRIPRDSITRFAIEANVRTEVVTLCDHDFRRPSVRLFAEARVPGADGRRARHLYQPGAFLVDDGTDAEGVPDERYGAALAARILESERVGHLLATFETHAVDVRPGTVVTIEDDPYPEIDPRRGLLVIAVEVEGTRDGEWRLQATAVPADEPYRPPRRTKRPRMGLHRAVVVGPPGEEIHTDAHGRVRVRFPWDREGERDERSSAWLRVTQGWAGPGFGAFTLPRVGQEVLVDFLDGDPDQPMVFGRLFNAVNPPPLKLPDDRTQSVWRSQTSPGGDGFSEIRIEDQAGSELLSFRAERDLGIRVRRDRAEVVGGDETTRVEGQRALYAGGDAHVTTVGDHRERVGGTRSLTVEGDQHQRIGGTAALEAGALHLGTAGPVVIEGSDITLRGPGGFLRIGAGGITIKGALLDLQGAGSPGEGPGAAPALPLEPQRVHPHAPGPRRLPLLGFQGGLPPRQIWIPKGAGGPLTADEVVLCGVICRCNKDPSPQFTRQACVKKQLWAMDDASGHTSKLKAEVPYDMSKKPPAPIMSKNQPSRATRRPVAGSRIPDVVIVKDPTRPPTQDNIQKVIEIKFPVDRLKNYQREDYDEIAGSAPFEEFGPEKCDCAEREEPQPEPVTMADLGEAALFTLLAIAMIANDAWPGGQLDDAAIPPTIARIVSKLAPLLRGAPLVF